MTRVTMSLLVLVVVMLGSSVGVSRASGPETGLRVATAMRTLLEELESGALSEDELAKLLFAELAASIASPQGGNEERSPDDAVVSVSDEATERRLQPSSATAANDAIMIGDTPVATLSSPLVIPAAAFTADGFDPDSVFFSFGAGYWTGNSAAYGCLIAPAALPRGVTVTDMFASVYDNDASREISVTLRRLDNFSGAAASMASATTAGAFNGVQTIFDASIDNPTVVYPDYSYYVTTCLGSSSLRLYSVRLYFTL